MDRLPGSTWFHSGSREVFHFEKHSVPSSIWPQPRKSFLSWILQEDYWNGETGLPTVAFLLDQTINYSGRPSGGPKSHQSRWFLSVSYYSIISVAVLLHGVKGQAASQAAKPKPSAPPLPPSSTCLLSCQQPDQQTQPVVSMDLPVRTSIVQY